MSKDPKPCPFCGGIAAFEPGSITYTDGRLYFLHCDECNASGPEADTPVAADNFWNQRIYE